MRLRDISVVDADFAIRRQIEERAGRQQEQKPDY